MKNKLKEEFSMKKKALNKIVALVLALSMCLGGINVLADVPKVVSEQNNSIVSPLFLVLVSYYNNLTLNFGGRLRCDGKTEVQYGYIAGITIELQQFNGAWNTIKTWNNSDTTIVSLSNDWYVSKGYQYRLKLTHTAMDSNWTVVDSCISYSKTVSYF